VRDHRHHGHLLRSQARDPLHQQRRGAAGVLHRPDCAPLAGQPTPSSESSQVRRVPASEVPGYPMDRSMRTRIKDYIARNDSPVII